MSANQTRGRSRGINTRLIKTGVRVMMALMLGVTLLAAPAAAAGASDCGSPLPSVGSTDVTPSDSSPPSLCDSEKLKYLINSVIQLAIFGGVALGAGMYTAAEAIDAGPMSGKKWAERARQLKKQGAMKVFKLSAVPVLFGLVVKGSPLAWSDCIKLVPF